MKSSAVVSAFIALLAIGCSGGPTSPSVPQLTGTWTGTSTAITQQVQALYGDGQVTATFAQSGSDLSGTIVVDYPNAQGGPSSVGSQFTGSVSGSSVQLSVPGQGPYCPEAATLTLNASQNQMSGTFSTVNCSLPEVGTVTLTRQ